MAELPLRTLSALDAVSRSEEQVRTIVDALPIMMLWFNGSDGDNVYQSRAWREFTGLSKEESNGRDWTIAVHPDDRPRFVQAWQRLFASGVHGEIDARVRRQDGTYRWFAFHATPHRDEAGQMTNWYGTMVDIDDSKRSEAALAALQAQMAHVARVVTLGELTAAIAHEVTQPLSAIHASANAGLRWLSRTPPNIDAARASFEHTVEDAERMANIVARLRLLFTEGRVGQQQFDINELVEQTLALTRAETERHDIEVRTDLSGSIPQAIGDRIQVQQVLLNLIANAIQAMTSLEDAARHLHVTTSAAAGGLRVGVADTGAGIHPNDIERIFEPFHTTKTNGMGLGLWISRSVIDAHGGHLWTESKPTGGAVFCFTLPSA